MLTTDVEARCSVAQLRLCHWTTRGPTSSLTPYRKIVYTEENCLQQLFHPENTHTAPYANFPSESTESKKKSPRRISHARFSSAADGRGTACAETTVHTVRTANIAPASIEVHRRKQSAVERLEQRRRVLNDPINTAVLDSVTPPPRGSQQPAAATGMKAKISSAGKKMFQTFVHHSSSPSD